ncbi:MAG: hypothetical protein ACR2JW_15955 [Thermomicrobiales bacterium]
MSRLYRVCVLTLLALGAWLIAASSVGAATVGAAIDGGPLTISPSTVHLSYTIPAGGSKHIVTSSFAVTVTDATGTAAGWMVRAASGATLGPLGQTTNMNHAIIDFNTTEANGVPPNPTCICDTIPTAFGEILRTPPQTGIGRSTEEFITQLTVPAGATPGTYASTIALDVLSLGPASPLPGPLPGVRPTGPTVGGPAPNPLPSALRPAPAGPTALGTPAPLPGSRPSSSAPASSSTNNAANNAASRPVVSANMTSDGAQATAAPAPPIVPATSDNPTASTIPARSSRVVDEPVAPRTTSGVQPSVTATVDTTASVVNDTTPVQPVAASNAAPSVTRGAAPVANPVTTSADTGNATPVTEHAYPVATMIGNVVSFAPAPSAGGDNSVVGAVVNWHLQATYTLAGHSAISRAFGRNTPPRMNAGTFAIVVTQTGLGQATMTFSPQQTNSERAVSESAAVVTISIVAGP